MNRKADRVRCILIVVKAEVLWFYIKGGKSMKSVSGNRTRSFALLFAWVLCLSLLITPSLTAATATSDEVAQNSKESIALTLEYPDTIAANMTGTLKVTVNSTTSETYTEGFAFPTGTKITVTLPGTNGLLFSDKEKEVSNGFEYAPSVSRRTMTVTMLEGGKYGSFYVDIPIIASTAGTFTNGVQTVKAGAIVAKLTGQGLKTVEVSNTSPITITGDPSGSIASGPGTATLRYDGQTISMRLTHGSGPVSMGAKFPIALQIWSTKNPFSIPKGTTVSFKLPSDSPLSFYGTQDGQVDSSLSLAWSIPSGSNGKELIASFDKALNDLSVFGFTTVEIYASGGDSFNDSSKSYEGGPIEVTLKMGNNSATAKSADDIEVSGGRSYGATPDSFSHTSAFNPSSALATMPRDAIAAVSDPTAFTFDVLPVGGNAGITRLVMNAKLVLPYGVNIYQLDPESDDDPEMMLPRELDEIELNVNVPQVDGADITWNSSAIDDENALLITFTADIDPSFEFTGFSASVGFSSGFTVDLSDFSTDPLVVTMTTSGEASVSGKAMKIDAKTVSFSITTPEPYSDAELEESELPPEMRYQGLTSVLPNHLSASESYLSAVVQSVGQLQSGTTGTSAQQLARELSGELASGMLNPGRILIDILRIAQTGLTK